MKSDEYAANSPEFQAALDAVEQKPKQKARKSCGSCGDKPEPVTAGRSYPWDERQFYRLQGLLAKAQKFGVIKIASIMLVGSVRWILYKLFSAWTFTKTILSGLCESSIYANRMQDCRDCPLMQMKDGNGYCGGCGCPKWYMSRLNIKNKFKRNHCPKGIHTR